MKKLLTDYPKILLLSCAFIGAYILYLQGAFNWMESHIDGYGYFSLVIAGSLYSFGFTSPFATAYFIAIAPDVSPVPAALLAGTFSTIADITIFEFISVSFHDEWLRIRASRFITRMYEIFHHETVPEFLRRLWKWIFASIAIASPLPDEIGITLLASMGDISTRKITVLFFVLNTVGIFTILMLSR